MMIQNQEPNRYIIFWETKEQALSKVQVKKFSILTILIKMIESSLSVDQWGRCEGVKRNGELFYNGFIIFNDRHETIEMFIKRYEHYIAVTGRHKFNSLNQTKAFLRKWNKLNR